MNSGEVTGRFSERVAHYVKYRPGYPPALVELLRAECGLAPGMRIADLGSGTGLLAKPLLDAGCVVIGVEPNAPMREAGEMYLKDHPGFTSIDGAAEHMPLPGASVEMVTAGQAFHWFDVPRAAAECRRVLAPDGWAVLVWNERLTESPFEREYEALLQRYSTDYQAVDHRNVDDARLTAFFQGPYKFRSLPNAQVLDRDGVLGRTLSCSYVPRADEPSYAPLMEALDALFSEMAEDERVRITYATKVYYGRLG